jgi:hypothetical protein
MELTREREMQEQEMSDIIAKLHAQNEQAIRQELMRNTVFYEN